MNYSEVKELYKEHGKENIRAMIDLIGKEYSEEILSSLFYGFSDFEVGSYRVIDNCAIDEIQQGELKSDEYVLGSFDKYFLADTLEIDFDVIEAMQKAEAYEAIGKLILSMGKLEELQGAYAGTDGYGHHFAHYDGVEHEIGNYYAFKVN